MVSFYSSRHQPFTKQVQTQALITILSLTKGMDENSQQRFVNKTIQKMELLNYTQTTAYI